MKTSLGDQDKIMSFLTFQLIHCHSASFAIETISFFYFRVWKLGKPRLLFFFITPATHARGVNLLHFCFRFRPLIFSSVIHPAAPHALTLSPFLSLSFLLRIDLWRRKLFDTLFFFLSGALQSTLIVATTTRIGVAPCKTFTNRAIGPLISLTQ
jgi:hypothetical protein